MLQRSATAIIRRQPGEKVMLSHSKSVRGLVRSTSNTNMKKAFVHDDPNAIPPVPPIPDNFNAQKDDDELKSSIQRVWAVLDGQAQQHPFQTENHSYRSEATSPSTSEMNSNAGRIQTVKALTTRIYIDDASTHKVVQLTNLLTSAMVIQYLRKKGLIDHANDWTIFEIANSHRVERPIREWEIVLDIISAWEPDSNNALLVKRYSYHYTLTSETIFQKMISPMYGWLSIEYKKGKWQKRFCFIKDNAIHHAKDKGASSSILCHLASYDVYTLLQPLKISPTPYVFAIRAQDRASIFEKEDDYIRFVATEDQEEMKKWVLSIRCAKNIIHYQYHPSRVVNPLAPIVQEEKKTTDDCINTLRRQKSTKAIPTMSRSESTRRLEDKEASSPRGLSRNPTTKKNKEGPLIDCSDPPTFAKGSLLAKEEEAEQSPLRLQQQQQQQLQQQQQTQSQHQSSQQAQAEENNTLIQIDDRVKFAKGSLLDQKEKETNTTPTKMMRSKSVRELTSSEHATENNHRRHMSLRRKPTTKKLHDAVPLPSNNTLLQLDDTPEKHHSRELHGRHVKPLLNFDSDERPRK
ncbi:unnamed protein product [Rhizopus microsporus]